MSQVFRSRSTRRQFAGLLLAGTQARSLFGATFRSKTVDDVLRNGMATRRIPAVAAMVVDGTRTLYTGAFGNRDAASKIPVNADSLFQIASMTKPITSVAAMQLVEQGRVGLDAPVSKFLPQLAEMQVLHGFTATGDPILRPAQNTITLRHLLSHTSGISYPTWHEGMFKYSQKAGVAPTSIAPVVPLMFEPGASWQYGYSVDWAGRLVEAISGLTLQQYFRKNILDPLGMNDTDFGVAPAKFDRLVDRYQRNPDGSFTAAPRVQPPPPTDFNGGGGLSSTANDYAKFMQMILRYGLTGVNTQVLQARSVEAMMKNQIGGLHAGVLKSFQPNVSSDVDTNPGGVDKWGLGFLLRGPSTLGGRAEGSMAWAGIYNTYFWIDPRRGIGGVIMMQYLPFYDSAAVGLLGEFERSVYANL
ncbi:MAG: serine hydrolase domain-containing protein [Acidobacteriota bacterium]